MKRIALALLSAPIFSVQLGCQGLAPESVHTAQPTTAPSPAPNVVSRPALPRTEQAYRITLEKWRGKQVDDLIASWGAPSHIFDSTNSPNKSYQWLRYDGEIIVANQTVPATCLTAFGVDPSGKLLGFRFDGNSCKTEDNTPGAYSGPTFSIGGVGHVVDSATLEMFSVIEFIGVAPLQTISCGPFRQGEGVPARCIGDELPVRPMKVHIGGLLRSDTMAQHRERVRQRTFLSVDGIVDFNPAAGGRYLVTGELKQTGSSVWIEDMITKSPVTQRVTSGR